MIYAYHCPTCDTDQERDLPLDANHDADCDTCGKRMYRRFTKQIAIPQGFTTSCASSFGPQNEAEKKKWREEVSGSRMI
jgi:hypothetical protein